MTLQALNFKTMYSLVWNVALF